MSSSVNRIKYIKNDSYEEYVAIQTRTNKQKINNQWVREENIIDIKQYCNKVGINPSRIICHGTRNGAEIQYFLKHFKNATVIGTEISDTANNFPNTVQWDFHERNPDWFNRFDIVFTNSWDHSYDLDKAVNSWIEQLTDNGLLILDWSSYSTSKPFNKADCCGCSLEDLKSFLSEKGKVYDIKTKGHQSERSHLVITSKV